MIIGVNVLTTNHAVTCFVLTADNCLLPTEVRKDALQLQKLLEYDDEGAEGKCWLIPPLDLSNVLLTFFNHQLTSVQASAHTWMMSINGLE